LFDKLFQNCFTFVSVLFQPTYIWHYENRVVGDEKMQTLKIALALAAIIGLTTLTVGLALAHYTNTPYNNTVPVADEDWWTQMQEYMESRWSGIEDQEWFDDMNQYMQERWTEVQNQTWFNQMLQYMQDHGYQPYCYEPYGYEPYGYSNYEDNYYGPRGYGRGFGCRGW
jgi:hypothetical protein